MLFGYFYLTFFDFYEKARVKKTIVNQKHFFLGKHIIETYKYSIFSPPLHMPTRFHSTCLFYSTGTTVTLSRTGTKCELFTFVTPRGNVEAAGRLI
jgi:hypothetical protein